MRLLHIFKLKIIVDSKFTALPPPSFFINVQTVVKTTNRVSTKIGLQPSPSDRNINVFFSNMILKGFDRFQRKICNNLSYWKFEQLHFLILLFSEIAFRNKVMRSVMVKTKFLGHNYFLFQFDCTVRILCTRKKLPEFFDTFPPPVNIGNETITIPVPLQTYFIKNCSNTTYQSFCKNILSFCLTKDWKALCKWDSST